MFATDDRVESHHHSDIHVFSFHLLAPSSVRKDLGHPIGTLTAFEAAPP